MKDSLKEAALPASVRAIGSECFYECTSLTSADLPDSLRMIGKYAFCRCPSLTSLNIPSVKTLIGSYAYGYYYSKDDAGIGSFNLMPCTLYGMTGSYAEEYAEGLGIDFAENQ